mmetsp:Transcript_13135/g.52402  ORF Transcript_13135/g.52402 Transcript_13135/m.52402 type:complete len:805 (+) Transcript_13135:65-2479(+)
MEAALEVVRTGLKQVRVPAVHDAVYREECGLCFHTAFSPGGVYVCLAAHSAYCKEHVLPYRRRTGRILYLRIQSTKKALPQPEQTDAAPTKMALGVEGGFATNVQHHEVKTERAVVALQEDGSEVAVPYPCPELPMLVTDAAKAVLAHVDGKDSEEVAAWEEELKESKYARGLVQLDNGVKISPDPRSWRCAESGMRENLWLNLSTGHIGSGRKNWDGTGGTGAALKHFEETGKKYPLVVKLGTITPHGADVYSYAEDENDNVTDPLLAEHLSHWGIDMLKMQKTEKTMAELQIDLNLSYEWGAITEDGLQLTPVTGAGHIGLRNLGNSCYCNSLFQVLFSLPQIANRYLSVAPGRFEAPCPCPAEDLLVQLSKLAVGLCTDRYAGEGGAVSPGMIKNLLGKGHPDFSGKLQQDVHDYYQHFLTRISRADKAAGEDQLDITKHFRFMMETRTECLQSNQVRYSNEEDNTWALSVPLEAATNKEEVAAYKAKAEATRAAGGIVGPSEKVLLHVPFEALLEAKAAAEVVADYLSPATGAKGAASVTKRLATFPDVLVVQLRRYVLGENWLPAKIDARIPMPEQLDLSAFRGHGLREGEVELPQESSGAAAAAAAPVADPSIVSTLQMMGFSENACARAALAVNNAGVEPATNWLMEHMADADINDPPASSSSASSADAEVVVDEEAFAILLSMGIDGGHARRGLVATGGSIERAVEWCFSHPQDMDESDDSPAAAAASPAQGLPDGEGKYELRGFVSHLGPNTNSGHYVCHIKRDGRWVIYNDALVALSQKPPLDMGFLYFYRRVQ